MPAPMRVEKPAKPRQKPLKKHTTSSGGRSYPARKVQLTGRTVEALDHPESIAEWDDEELARGYRRDRNGRFTGAPPKIIPREVYMELQRRHVDAAARYLAEHAKEMAEVLVEIATFSKDDKARVAAAKYLLDRVMGTPSGTQKIEGTLALPKFLGAIEAGIVNLDDEVIIETTAREKGAA